MFYLQMDILQLADVLQNFVKTFTDKYGINPLYSFLAPGYTWKAGLKFTETKLDYINELLLLLEKNIRGRIAGSLGDRYRDKYKNFIH